MEGFQNPPSAPNLLGPIGEGWSSFGPSVKNPTSWDKGGADHMDPPTPHPTPDPLLGTHPGDRPTIGWNMFEEYNMCNPRYVRTLRLDTRNGLTVIGVNIYLSFLHPRLTFGLGRPNMPAADTT